MFFFTARRSVGKADSTSLWGPPLEGEKIFQNEAFYIKTLVRKKPMLFSEFSFPALPFLKGTQWTQHVWYRVYVYHPPVARRKK